jgi:hypothetical protein
MHIKIKAALKAFLNDSEYLAPILGYDPVKKLCNALSIDSPL